MRLLILGATSLIAQETAKNFAADGADMALVGRDEARLKSIAADLKVRGAGKTETLVADLADLPGHAKLIEDAASAIGGIDAVLIAHGTLVENKLPEQSVEEMLAQMITNALSYMSLMTLLANRLEQQHSGCICVISSVAGDRGRKYNYVYGSAKAAVTAFSSGLRARLATKGVSVVTIKPGPIDTPMTASHKKTPLFGKADAAGKRTYEAMLKGEDVVYVPWFWGPIMLVLRAIPERFFKKVSF
ncbi:MAG TPA: SDR family oxidoreductase [Dehalococcoidia bacterium]|nr:SDR family oxidoreductase [Dehalococcoidia bacterium]